MVQFCSIVYCSTADNFHAQFLPSQNSFTTVTESHSSADNAVQNKLQSAHNLRDLQVEKGEITHFSWQQA
jgi:hypothetical protein